MGQGYSLTTLPAGPSAIEAPELSDLTFERGLGGARFLRTVRARHRHGIVVAKVCMKSSGSVSFKKYARALKSERHSLQGVANVLVYQRILETSNLGVLLRQFIHTSLYDRMSIRPFLESIEKKWIAFQLLCAVRDCHSRGIFHGDIKSENVLVTSWGWIYLTDFSSAFKPVYLPEDNPADFSFYYDTSARRTCYLAPERFLAAGQKPTDDVVQWNMDIFSLGCVIAELFTETPTFTLSQLFKFRKGEYDPTIPLLNKVDDEHVRALIGSMLKLNPEDRWHAQDYLDEHKGRAFPLYFYQHLHTLMQEITDPSSGRSSISASDINNGECDDRIDRIYNDFEMISVSLDYQDADEGTSHIPGQLRGLFPLQVDLPNTRHIASPSLVPSGDNGTFILLNVVTASIRSAARAATKIRACELLLAFAERLPDEAKLDRVLPYIMLLLDDNDEMVLVAALRTMTQLLALVTVASPVNSFLFTQYVFPRLQSFVKTAGFKHNPIVRATYAACLASLAETASRFLDMIQALRADGSLPTADAGVEDDNAAYYDAFDATRLELLDSFEAQTKVFLTDTDTSVRRAFLSSVSSLCVFFGETKASDVILSHLNTYLNDPDWLLKCAFFKTIVGVAVYIGGASLEEFILPLMMQALTDPQESVVEQALRSLASMAEIGLPPRPKTWELIDVIARFEMHPNQWIREAASHFVSASTTYLSVADVRILVAPLLKPYLKVPVGSLSEAELLDALKKPLPRTVLDMALQWAHRADRGVFWKPAKDARQLSYSGTSRMPPFSSVIDSSKPMAKVPKNDEDEQWLGRLRNAGMRTEDEMKILAFREYLWRAAQRSRKDDTKAYDEPYDQVVSLANLKVTPHTVFFDSGLDLYEQHMNGQNQQRTVEEALQEAASAAKTSESRATTVVGDGEPIRKIDQLPSTQPRKLSGVRKQTSGSGQSLSSSPSSGIGLLAKDHDGSAKRRGSLKLGSDLRNKVLADVQTDDVTAAGKLSTPRIGSRRTSPAPSTTQKRPNAERSASHRAIHNYAGNDPTVLKLLDTVYVDSFPTDAAEFGPIIQTQKRGPIPSNSNQHTAGLWRPQGRLTAVLNEHKQRVSRIMVSHDHTFFLTGSDDGTVRVWDAERLERNVTHRPRQTYQLGTAVKVTSLCFVESTHAFICTGSDGSVHAVRVEVDTSGTTTKYGKLRVLRQWQIPNSKTSGECAVWSEHYRGESASTLVLTTDLNRILVIDLRYMTIIFELHSPAQHGKPTCFCIGRRHDWLLVGTTHGVLDLWDLRFRLRLRSWTFPNAAPITRLQLHPSRKTARRNRVCVSGGTARGEVTVWDIEKVICHEVYQPASAQSSRRLNLRDYEIKNLDEERSEGLLSRVAGSVAGDAETFESSVSVPAVATALYVGLQQVSSDSDNQQAFVISGGPDGKVRFWDAERFTDSRVVSGALPDEKVTFTRTDLGLDTKVIIEKVAEADPQANGQQPSDLNKAAANTSTKRGTGSSSSNKPSRYEAIRLSAQHLLSGHLDTITDVALLEHPFGMILSADRSGQVFVHQ